MEKGQNMRIGREKIIEYVVKKYGKDNVCQIITFGTMAARAVVRDVGRVLSVPYSEVDKIAKKVTGEQEPKEERVNLHNGITKILMVQKSEIIITRIITPLQLEEHIELFCKPLTVKKERTEITME